MGVRLHEPGSGADDPLGTDVNADGLARLFDEFAALGIDDAFVWSISKSLASVDRIAEARRLHQGGR